MKNAPLVNKSLKKTKSKSLIKQIFRELLDLTTIFNAIISLTATKTVYHTGATIYKDVTDTQAIIAIIDSFPTL